MLIASIVLSLASLAPSPVLAPEGPPVYGPCAPTNPITNYTPIPEGFYDQACWYTYEATYTGQLGIYWARIEQCPAGDCACYAAAWAQFLAAMDQAEADAWGCDYNAGN